MRTPSTWPRFSATRTITSRGPFAHVRFPRGAKKPQSSGPTFAIWSTVFERSNHVLDGDEQSAEGRKQGDYGGIVRHGSPLL